MIELALDEVRRIALWRQGLLAPAATPAAVARMKAAGQVAATRAMVDRLGAVQLDTISVLARSHELVAYARLGAVGRQAVEQAYWSDAACFEYWSHAASILPMRAWPLFAFRRREFVRKGQRWHRVEPQAIATVLERLADGPVTTAHVGGAKRGGPWWD